MSSFILSFGLFLLLGLKIKTFHSEYLVQLGFYYHVML